MSSADILKITVTISDELFSFICCYGLHCKSIQEFIVEFSDLLNSERAANLIVLGGLNLDLLTNTPNLDACYLLNSEHGLTSFINEPTRPETGTCIDHISGRFSKIDLNDCGGIVFDLGISDHCMTGIIFKVLRNAEQINVKRKNRLLKIDFEKLIQYLLVESWEEVHLEENPSNAYVCF